MLRVGERVLLLALSEEPDKHPLGYLSSRLLTDVEGGCSVPSCCILLSSCSKFIYGVVDLVWLMIWWVF